MNFTKSIITLSIMIAVLFCGAIAFGQGAKITINRIAAVVDENIITVYDVERASAPIIEAFSNSSEAEGLAPEDLADKVSMIKMQVLNDMIEEKLLEAEVNRLGIPVDDQEIDEYIDKIKAANRMTDEQLATMLASEGTSMVDFRERIRLQILREQYVRYRLKEKVEIDDEEARAYYKQHQEDFVAEKVITLSEIRVGVPPDAAPEQIEAIKAKVSKIYEELLAGKDFAAIAKRYSDGPTASSGGDLGSWKIKSELAPSYRDAAEGLKEGDISTPYLDSKGYVILKCFGWKEEDYLPFEMVASKIKIKLQREAAQREMEKLAKELRAKSFVEVKVDNY